ncbi:MAG: heat-inducible transcriptional repressor HrcA, partial [Deltaproteobacteria bacterium]
DIVIEGQTNLLNYPEFSDVEQMKKLLATFEEKTKIIRLLDKCLSSGGVHIILGSEAEFQDVQDMSLISSTYSRGGDILGALGVIGPTRMDYSRIIPLVDYTAKLLSQIFEDE